MGFTKRFLPDLEILKKMREEIGDDRKFINSVLGKADCYIGGNGSSQYMDEIIKELENGNNG